MVIEDGMFSKKAITTLLSLFLTTCLCACGSNTSNGTITEENTIQPSIKTQESHEAEPETAGTKASIDFTEIEAQEAYDTMVEFMKDPALVAGTPIRLRGKVTSTELVGWKKWYSVELSGKGGYESGATTDTDITAYPVILEEAGIAKLETVSFQVEMIDEDDAEVQSGVVTIQLPE